MANTTETYRTSSDHSHYHDVTKIIQMHNLACLSIITTSFLTQNFLYIPAIINVRHVSVHLQQSCSRCIYYKQRLSVEGTGYLTSLPSISLRSSACLASSASLAFVYSTKAIPRGSLFPGSLMHQENTLCSN